MQLRLPWTAASKAPERLPRAVAAGGRVFPLIVVRHPWARRYLIRVTDEGDVKLTVPRRAAIGEGVRFAHAQAAWIAAEWTRLTDRRTWRNGTLTWYRGTRQAIAADADGLRLGSLVLDTVPVVGDIRVSLQGHLRALAMRELPARCLALGIAHGLEPLRVAVRDQRSRWGACSAKGVITLNWRLVQMSDEVSDYVMLHELAHLRQPNHSRLFWREVAVLCPGWRSSERWLRQHGRELM